MVGLNDLVDDSEAFTAAILRPGERDTEATRYPIIRIACSVIEYLEKLAGRWEGYNPHNSSDRYRDLDISIE